MDDRSRFATASPSQGRFDGTTRTLVKQAIVVTGTAAGEFRGDILIDGGHIVAIEPQIEAADVEVVDGFDYLVTAGFVDTHRHLWQTALKGFAYDLTLMQYLHRVYGGHAANFRPEDIYASTYLGRLAALDAGVTTVLDWSHNVNSTEMEDAGIQAHKDAGGRSVFGHGYSADRQLNPMKYHKEPRSFALAKRVRDLLPSDDALVTCCFLGHEPGYFISIEACAQEYATARELGMRISTHLVSLGEDGGRFASIEALHKARLMGPDVTYIHLIAASAHELTLIADTGGTASVAAQLDAHFGGFESPPTGRLMMAGVRPSFSVDTVVAASEDFFSQMRAAIDVERVLIKNKFQPRPEGFEITLRDVFEFATYQGARATGLDKKIGTVEVGKEADLLFIRTDSPNMLPVNDPIASIVYSANVGDIDTVLVAGKAVKRNGRLVADMQRARDLIEKSVEHLYWQDKCGVHDAAVRPHPAAIPRCMCGGRHPNRPLFQSGS